MRVYLIAAAVIVVVVGGFWLVLAFSFGHLHGGSDAYNKSAACVRDHASLASDPADSARFQTGGLQALGIRWRNTRAVALFDDALSGTSVGKAEHRITAGLQRHGASPAEIAARLLEQDNVALYYLNHTPSRPAQTAIGRCVYLVHYNDAAAFFGVYINPHAERPFLPGARRD